LNVSEVQFLQFVRIFTPILMMHRSKLSVIVASSLCLASNIRHRLCILSVD